jgi:hypothetical protein
MLVRVWCSMPPPQGKATMPYFSARKGYSPHNSAIQPIISGTREKFTRAAASSSG